MFKMAQAALDILQENKNKNHLFYQKKQKSSSIFGLKG